MLSASPDIALALLPPLLQYVAETYASRSAEQAVVDRAKATAEPCETSKKDAGFSLTRLESTAHLVQTQARQQVLRLKHIFYVVDILSKAVLGREVRWLHDSHCTRRRNALGCCLPLLSSEPAVRPFFFSFFVSP